MEYPSNFYCKIFLLCYNQFRTNNPYDIHSLFSKANWSFANQNEFTLRCTGRYHSGGKSTQ